MSADRSATPAQPAARDSRDAAIIDAALDCILTIDAGGRLVEYNPAAERTFGWQRDRVIGQSIDTLLVPERYRAAHRQALDRTLSTGEMRLTGRRVELEALCADGSEIPIELIVTRIQKDGEPAFTAFIRDLTERHAAEARLRQVERERANLARFFAPQIVEELIGIDTPLSAARIQPAAVLFADMVGFTDFCSGNAPDQVIDLLRGFLARLSEAVFSHHGTIDKFLGDGMMAVFGSPHPGPRDATNAVGAGLAIVAAITRWNEERATDGLPALGVAVGIHYGEVVLGDIGSAQRLELTVLGDTVNVASRVEGLCRRFRTPLLVTQAVTDQLALEGGTAELAAFEDLGLHQLRGRNLQVRVYCRRLDEPA